MFENFYKYSNLNRAIELVKCLDCIYDVLQACDITTVEELCEVLNNEVNQAVCAYQSEGCNV